MNEEVYAIDYGYPWGYYIAPGCMMLLEHCSTFKPKEFTWQEACKFQSASYREGRACRIAPYPKLKDKP